MPKLHIRKARKGCPNKKKYNDSMINDEKDAGCLFIYNFITYIFRVVWLKWVEN